MKTKNLFIVLSLAILLPPTVAHARRVTISPARIVTIVSPLDSRDSRVLMFFELPSDVMKSKARVDFATLLCKAQVMDARMGQIDVVPVTADWKNAGAISWSSPWSQPGGDCSSDFLTNNYSLKSELGAKEIAINVTEIVQKWQSGELANNGIMLRLSADDLRTSTSLKYTLDLEKVLLTVFYSYENR